MVHQYVSLSLLHLVPKFTIFALKTKNTVFIPNAEYTGWYLWSSQ